MTKEGLFLLAFVIETLVERFCARLNSELKPWITAAVGVLLAFGFQLAAFTEVLGMAPIHPMVDYVLTGFVLGGGSNYLHDLLEGAVAKLNHC